jgi:ribonuclease R
MSRRGPPSRRKSANRSRPGGKTGRNSRTSPTPHGRRADPSKGAPSQRAAGAAHQGRRPPRESETDTKFSMRNDHQHPRAERRGRGPQHGGHGSSRPSGSRSGTVVEGTVSVARAGYGFLRVEGMKDSVFLPPGEMRGVMHGDRLRVRVERDQSDRYLGSLEKILERGVHRFLGTIELQGRQAWVNAADRRMQLHCRVSHEDLRGARDRDWVIGRITHYGSPTAAPQATVEKRLDPARPVEMAMEAGMARFELPQEFPPGVLEEAGAWGDRVDPREAGDRVDLRELPLVTIDGEDAKDFDDAVYAEEHRSGYRIIVAIADVSHYVRPGTALDDEARARGTSVYLPNRVIPMLPHALSDHLCSLAPNVDRLCFAADMIISRTGQLKDARFYPAVMRSHARLTYTLANAALFEGRPAARKQLGPLLDPLLVLVDVYRALYKARHARGALDFDAPEAEVIIDPPEQVREIAMRSRNDAHRLIEECMILANVAVAGELQHTHTPSLYRVHGEPDEQKLDKLAATLRALGIGAEIPQDVTTRDLQRITHHLGNSPDRPFIETLIVRSMPQAVYQPADIGHFGLALTHYAHFTSPIRRYPDLVVHRTLREAIGARGAGAARYETAELEELGESTSRLEKRADEADRYVTSFLKCTYLLEHIGETFDGLITTVTESGCFIQILAVGIDGLLRIEFLRDDEYVMEDDGHGWVGLRKKRRLRSGSHVKVIVTGVNQVEGLVDLSLPADR